MKDYKHEINRELDKLFNEKDIKNLLSNKTNIDVLKQLISERIYNRLNTPQQTNTLEYVVDSLAYTYASLDHTDTMNKNLIEEDLIKVFKRYSENYRTMMLEESKNNIPKEFQIFSNKDIQPIKFTQLEYKSLFNEFIEGLLEVFNDSPLTNEKGLRVEKSTVEAIKYRLLDLLKSVD